jgi:hypothetical protein
MNDQLAELASEVERLKIRVARLEQGQLILVVSIADLESLATISARSQSDCLYALRETGGNMGEAVAFLQTMGESVAVQRATH